jgi:hypothetical protein
MSFPSQAGMSQTKLPLGRNNSVMTSLFPPRECLVVTYRLGTGNSRTFFFTVWLSGVAVGGCCWFLVVGCCCRWLMLVPGCRVLLSRVVVGSWLSGVAVYGSCWFLGVVCCLLIVCVAIVT